MGLPNLGFVAFLVDQLQHGNEFIAQLRGSGSSSCKGLCWAFGSAQADLPFSTIVIDTFGLSGAEGPSNEAGQGIHLTGCGAMPH